MEQISEPPKGTSKAFKSDKKRLLSNALEALARRPRPSLARFRIWSASVEINLPALHYYLSLLTSLMVSHAFRWSSWEMILPTFVVTKIDRIFLKRLHPLFIWWFILSKRCIPSIFAFILSRMSRTGCLLIDTLMRSLQCLTIVACTSWIVRQDKGERGSVNPRLKSL